MTSAKTNYGVILGKQDSTNAYPTIGEVVSIDPPEMLNPAVEATNHGSGGVREFVTSGLAEVAEFKATLNYVKADIAVLYADLRAGTKSRYQIAFDSLNAVQFGAIVTGIKPLPADAKNPDVLQAEATFRPSDSFSISS
jgi:hypothetical protein